MRHDDHYAKMTIQPIEVMEQVAANTKDPIAGLRVAMACKYLLRAGTKDGWSKDLEKASNYLYRALHGVWPWDEQNVLTEPAEQIQSIYNVLGPKAPECSGCKAEWDEAIRICLEAGCTDIYADDGAHPPRRDCGCAECEKSFPENCDGSPNVPPRDSGEALVGRECLIWFDDERISFARSAVVVRFL